MADSKLFTMIMFEVQWLPDYFTEMQTHKFVQDSISFFVFFFVFFFAVTDTCEPVHRENMPI